MAAEQGITATASTAIVVQRSSVDANKLLLETLGIRLTEYSAKSFASTPTEDGAAPAAGVWLPTLKSAVVQLTDEQFDQLLRLKGKEIEAIYRDWEFVLPDLPSEGEDECTAEPSTWALEEMGVLASRATGTGVKVAILDSGFDASRRGFDGPDVVRDSILKNGSTADVYGHGTHCAGLVGGGTDANGNRFGVAPNVELYCCKVLNKQNGRASNLVTGLEWAIQKRVDLILVAMEFSELAARSVDFEAMGRRALDNGAVIIAAAGNNGPDGTVRLPAATPSMVAVAATARNRDVLARSSTSGTTTGSQVDFAAPGECIYSAIHDGRFMNVSGTSMAAALAAGVAALWIEQEQVRGQALLDRMTGNAVNQTRVETARVGAGIVRAPEAN